MLPNLVLAEEEFLTSRRFAKFITEKRENIFLYTFAYRAIPRNNGRRFGASNCFSCLQTITNQFDFYFILTLWCCGF